MNIDPTVTLIALGKAHSIIEQLQMEIGILRAELHKATEPEKTGPRIVEPEEGEAT